MKFGVFFLQACVLAVISCAHIVAHPVIQSNAGSRIVELGDVNKKAVKLPMIEYPRAAREAGVHGIVKVRVWINKRGDVIRTSIVSGPRPLRSVSLRSAKRAKFPPGLGDCELCRSVTGVMTYTFVQQDPLPGKP